MGWKRRLELNFRDSFLYRQSVVSESTVSSVEKEVKVKKPKVAKVRKASPRCTDYLLHDWRVRIVYVLLLGGLLGLVIPTLFSVLAPEVDPTSRSGTCSIQYNMRIPLPASDYDKCTAMGGCWNASAPVGGRAPRCYHTTPSRYSYKIKRIYNSTLAPENSYSEIEAKYYVDVRLEPAHLKKSAYGTNIEEIRLTVYTTAKDRLVIRASKQFGKEDIKNRIDLKDSDFQVFATQTVGSYFRLQIFRRSTKTSLFDLTSGVFLLSKEYNEFSTPVPTPYVYGLGGPTTTKLLRDFNSTSWTLHNLPYQAGENGKNGYHPFYLAFEPNGDAHGVLISNGAPLEVTFLPGPALHFKTIGNDLKIHIFSGPSPKEVTNQTISLIDSGSGLYMPPDWVFEGLHLCRETHNSTIFRAVVEKLKEKNIAVASDCIDKFLFPFGDFQHDSASFPNAQRDIEWLKDQGVKFVPTYPPQIKKDGPGYESGQFDLFIRDDSLNFLYGGFYNNQTVVYPSFGGDFANGWIRNLINSSSLSFNGLFLIDNTPLDDASSCIESLPFEPVDVTLSKKTICPVAKHNEAGSPEHIYRHNRYGFSQLEKTFTELYYNLDCEACDGNVFLITESSYIGGNYYDFYSTDSVTGYHGSAFLGDFTLDWTSLKMALVRLQEYGLYGNPLTVMPICGTLNSKNIKDRMKQEELCTCWYQLGALSPIPYSLTREGHNSTSPEVWTTTFTKHVRDLFDLRRKLQFSSILTTAFQNREPVIRPLFYDFPKDKNTWTIDNQVMVGPNIMAVPNIEEGQPLVLNVYFPPGKWSDFYTPEALIYSNEEVGGWRSVQTNPYLISLFTKV